MPLYLRIRVRAGRRLLLRSEIPRARQRCNADKRNAERGFEKPISNLWFVHGGKSLPRELRQEKRRDLARFTVSVAAPRTRKRLQDAHLAAPGRVDSREPEAYPDFATRRRTSMQDTIPG